MHKNDKKSLLSLNISWGGTGLTELSFLAKHLAVMLKSGMPITEALAVTVETSTGKLTPILIKVLESVRSGSTLSESLKRFPKVFSNLFISSTYAGEQSGNLDGNLEKVAEHLEKDRDLVVKIKGAMFYPLVVMSAAVLLGVLLAYFVLPKITPMFASLNTDLPASTKALISVSEFIQHNGFLFFALVFGVIALLIFISKQKFIKPFTHWMFIHIPIVKKISRGANLANFSRSLSSLLESGLVIDEALEVTAKMNSNYYYQRALKKISKSVAQGSKLSSNLEQYPDLFPLIVARMVKVGEQSGSIEENLKYLTSYYEVEVDSAVKSFSTSIEPILLLVIGGVVAFLGLSIITPMYEISGGINR